MKNNLFLFVLFFICACDSVLEKPKSFESARLSDDGKNIILECDTFHNHSYYVSLGSLLLDSGIVDSIKTLPVSKLIKKSYVDLKEIALIGAKNNFSFDLNLHMDELDTVFHIKQTITTIEQPAISFTGFGAPLIRKNVAKSAESDLRIWLYRKKEHIDDSLFNKYMLLYAELTNTGYNDYIPQGTMPVVKNLDGVRYKINTDLKADYYAVVACASQTYIDQFIEQLVGNNFKGASTTLSEPLVCYYRKNRSGYRNVFLLCINKDWSYHQIPIATFAFDNEPPRCNIYEVGSSRYYRYYGLDNPYFDAEPSELKYNNKIRVLYPSNSPRVFGGAVAAVKDWDGNGLECNVTFYLSFSGDTKSITIQRRGELCYYNEILGPHFKPEDRTFYAKDYHGSHVFSYKMHFESGDNMIPVIVEDYHGNVYKDNIIVKAKFVRRDSPSINIENNNTIYND